MLNEEQIHVLVLLRDLAQSALSSAEQAGYVTLTNEAIMKLEDEAEEARLLGAPEDDKESFVTLARLRLVEAQQSAARRFDERRLARVAKLGSNDDTDLNADVVVEPQSSRAPESEDEVARSMHEAKSESITEVLQRMHDLAQAEILKGELNISELDMSSKTLRELQEKYSSVDVLLNGSRKLVQILDEADKADRRYMQLSLGFLAAVLMYIIYRRILSGPIKVLLWSLFQFVGLIKWIAPKQPPQSAGLTGQQHTALAVPTILESSVQPDVFTATTLTNEPPSETFALTDDTAASIASVGITGFDAGDKTNTDSQAPQDIYHAEL